MSSASISFIAWSYGGKVSAVGHFMGQVGSPQWHSLASFSSARRHGVELNRIVSAIPCYTVPWNSGRGQDEKGEPDIKICGEDHIFRAPTSLGTSPIQFLSMRRITVKSRPFTTASVFVSYHIAFDKDKQRSRSLGIIFNLFTVTWKLILIWNQVFPTCDPQ